MAEGDCSALTRNTLLQPSLTILEVMDTLDSIASLKQDFQEILVLGRKLISLMSTSISNYHRGKRREPLTSPK